MSEIIKTEAIVLSKINFSDTSKIATLFTKNYGKMNVIVKGGRQKNSGVGIIIDPINVVNLVVYQKNSRDIQILSSADLVHSFPKLKENFESLKYCIAIIELVNYFIHENETNERLFNGIKKIFLLMNDNTERSDIIFLRFFFFFLKEIGYDIRLDLCTLCEAKIEIREEQFINFSLGLICFDCSENQIISRTIPKELFDSMKCLKNRGSVNNFSLKQSSELIGILENFLKFHSEDFKGINSLKL